MAGFRLIRASILAGVVSLATVGSFLPAGAATAEGGRPSQAPSQPIRTFSSDVLKRMQTARNSVSDPSKFAKDMLKAPHIFSRLSGPAQAAIHRMAGEISPKSPSDKGSSL